VVNLFLPNATWRTPSGLAGGATNWVDPAPALRPAECPICVAELVAVVVQGEHSGRGSEAAERLTFAGEPD
jgi:hypothetical protein